MLLASAEVTPMRLTSPHGIMGANPGCAMMMRILAIATGILALVMPGSVKAGLPGHQNPDARHAELFGIRLGYPLDLPACNGGFASSTGKFQNGLCRQKVTPIQPGAAQITIRFADDALPQFIDPAALGTFNVIVFKGVVQGIEFTTDGLEGQSPVLGMLLTKFGKPVRVDRNDVLNANGQKVGEIDANWLVGTDHVNFKGCTDVTDRGYIEASTTDQTYRARQEKLKEKRANPHD
jgi:hypothetical protein